jgi:hypothetical protein
MRDWAGYFTAKSDRRGFSIEQSGSADHTRDTAALPLRRQSPNARCFRRFPRMEKAAAIFREAGFSLRATI